MKIGDGECEYLLVYLNWSAGSIAVKGKIGKKSFVEGFVGEAMHVEMEEFLVQLHLILLVFALQ